MRSNSLVVTMFLFFVLVGAGLAQTSKGIVAGVVRDASGAVISGATVTVTNQDTTETRTTTTASTGAYRVEAINPGTYKIHVDMTGFRAEEITDLKVLPSVVTTYDAVLNVGSVGETISVEAISNEINRENGQLSGTVDTKELQTVPIFSLSPFELVATLPGVQLVNPNLNLGGIAGNYTQLTVNGARPRSNNYLLDGQDINDVGIGGQSFNPQVPDMYQSTTVLLNSSSSEYGRSGGAIINLVTKSGTNKYHGTAFELYSGSGLNALDGLTRKGKPFPPGSPNPKARFNQHQFGFTLGGPLWKDKLFAFGGSQWTRFYGKSNTPNTIELPDQQGYNLLTAIGGQQVALLQGLLNSGSYLKEYANQSIATGPPELIPISDRPGCRGGCTLTTANFLRPPVTQQQPDTQWLYRIDFIPRPSDTFTVRYLHDRSNFSPDLSLNTSGLPGFDGEVGGPVELAEVTWTHVFTPHLLNEFRASEVRLGFLFDLTPEAKANPLSKTFNLNFLDNNFPVLGISQNIPQGRKQELYQFQDTVGWTKGKQSLRMGADVGRDLEIDLVAQLALGELDFNAGGTTASNGLSAVDNFLDNQLGTSGFARKTFGPTRVDPHLWKIGAFIQDDIKLSPQLTVNLGVRYDYVTVPDNVLKYPAVDPHNPYAPIDTVVKVQKDTNNIGPRIGFAFVPNTGFFSDGKTVIHGGIGVFYDNDFTNILINTAQASPNAPTGNRQSNAPGGLPDATGQLDLITPVLDPLHSLVQSVASNLVNPLTYQYNFGVERELPAAIKLTVNYVGARGEKLFSNRQLNYFGGIGQPRLNPTRNAINIRDNRADSNYNAAQVEVSRNFVHGLFFRASYAFAKNLDDASEVFATFASPTSYSANLAGDGLHQDWGNSVWDRRHVASFEYVYSPPGLHSDNRAANLLLSAFTRHITISGTTQFSSGPYSSFNLGGRDTNGDGSSANDRPLIGNRRAPITTAGIDGYYLKGGKPGVYYDEALYNTQRVLHPVTTDQVHFLVPHGSFLSQEIGRNSFENPGQSFWNVALEKAVPAPFTHLEGAQFVFRGEGQNVGNHNNVLPLNNNVLQVGNVVYLDKVSKREPTNQAFRLWAKFVF
ncbi:TonB-dependent receptor [Edaphobacter bradus]|uniref:TonB-dependent receptor n=1 Tax=Edaphobacter bradus TaxID=2259016 RepID=UPI0021E0C957|nr:TonB-dependent receptor [Edaphobacter bradus]